MRISSQARRGGGAWAKSSSSRMIVLASCCYTFFLLLLLPTTVEGRSVLGIDLGSLYVKVALVRSGSPLEIVTNMHSKRKTEQLVLFDNQQRFYGADANGLLQRKAQLTPASMSQFLGRDDTHPNVQALIERHFPVTPVYNETRKGLVLTVPKAGDFTPEELVSMILQHAVDCSVSYAKEAGSNIPPPTDIVLTVPCYYTQVERLALLDAAKLANLNVLALIDETTAAALHYAHDKHFEGEPQTFLFYNMGATSLQVSIVKFFQYEPPKQIGKPNKPVPALQVLAKAYDATLGGLAWDHAVVEYLADEFNKLWRAAAKDESVDIRTIQRPMTKLRLAANKAKHVLSANTEYPISLDALHDNVSLKLTLTRADLERLTAPLLERAVQPVLDVLEGAAAAATAAAAAAKKDSDDGAAAEPLEPLTFTAADNLTGIELLGGGMRVPSLQAKLQEILAPVELGLHMNADESMALGAAFAGANVSTAFRVRPVGLTDLTLYSQQVRLSNLPPANDDEEDGASKKGGWFSKFRKTKDEGEGETAAKKSSDGEEAEEEEWNKKATLFKANSKVGVKKTIAFTHDQDVHCALDYVGSDAVAQSELQRYEISGVAEFAKEMLEKNLTGVEEGKKPKVSLQFELSASGLTSLIKAEATMDELYTVEEEVEVDDEDDNSTDTSAGDETEEETKTTSEETAQEERKTEEKDSAEDSKEEADAKEEETEESANATADDGGNTTEKPKEEKKKKKTIKVEKEKKRVHKRTLKVSMYYEGRVQPHWDELMAASKAKLEEMDEKDRQRVLLEESKNKVESYMFMVKNKLLDDEEELATVSTEAQREECSKLASDTELWLEDDGYSADFATMEDKYAELSTPFEKILLRLKEKTARPAMVTKVTEKLDKAVEILEKWKTTMPQITEEEHEKALERIESIRTNITALEEAQAALEPHDEALAFLSTDLPPKLAPLEALMQRLSKKPKPKPPKKNETSANATNTTAEDEDDNATTTTSSEDGDDDDSEGADSATDAGDDDDDAADESGSNGDASADGSADAAEEDDEL